MNIVFPPTPDIKFDVDPMQALFKQEERGIEPIINEFKLKQEEPSFQIKQESMPDEESDCDDDEIVQTESENESNQSSSKDNVSLNEKIHQRIKQLLGSNYSKIKTEKDEETKSNKGTTRSGRGKWHYACDQRYGFNVSYSNGDTIISMGQVFIIQTPKMSISSKYRGYPIPVIEGPSSSSSNQLVIDDSELSRGSRFRPVEQSSYNSITRSYQSSSGLSHE